jgi:hypothetical protein
MLSSPWLKKAGAVVAGAILAFPRLVGAHGFLARPAARNVQHNSDWCPHCLSAGGTEAVWRKTKGGGKPPRFGVCGDPADGPRHHEVGGKYATPPRLAGTYRSGGKMHVRVTLTANHQGRWSLRLCPLPSPSPSSERKHLSQTCLNQHVLRRADGSGPYTYVRSDDSDFAVTYRLPRVRCRRCVLQWLYETGNSCAPRGIPRAYAAASVGTCGPRYPGELFVNCADIALR